MSKRIKTDNYCSGLVYSDEAPSFSKKVASSLIQGASVSAYRGPTRRATQTISGKSGLGSQGLLENNLVFASKQPSK